MIGNAPSWRSSDGKFHTDYVSGLKHEVMLWLTKAGENEVGAKKIVESFNSESVSLLIEYLTEIKKEMDTPSQFRVVKLDDGNPLVAVIDSDSEDPAQTGLPADHQS